MKVEVDLRSNLSYEDFTTQYLYAHKPVVITDAIAQWKAVSRWTPEFFKTEFGALKFQISEGERGQKQYEEGGASEYTMAGFIDRVLESTEDSPAPYFRNRILDDIFPSLTEDIKPLPKYLFPNWLPEHYVIEDVGRVLNRGAATELYIGGKGSSFPVLHYDGLAVHAFLMQIYGRKRFILYPPEQEPFLYPLPEKENLSSVNSVDNPDLARFPLFAKAEPTMFVLESGQTAFIPSHWWHTTKMLTPSISISFNVVNQSNWHELIDYVSRRQHNPLISLGSRTYLTAGGAWRSWRDRHSCDGLHSRS